MDWREGINDLIGSRTQKWTVARTERGFNEQADVMYGIFFWIIISDWR